MTATVEPATGSKVAGDVQILPVDNDPTGFRVSVNLQNVPEGEHAWHIHQGACTARNAPVVVPFTADKDKAGIASAIVAGVDGKVLAEATVPGTMLSVDQLRSGDYSLHVHQKAGTEHGPSIACAGL
jgi:Cu/Zn superoxide dismutase